MAWLLDTNVAITMRDRNTSVLDRLGQLKPDPVLSIITVIELEGGIFRDTKNAGLRRERLDDMVEIMTILPFSRREAQIYGLIIAELGFVRSRVLDRMIAAQAIAHDATLVTMNGDDFRGIDRLKLEIWPSA